MEKSEKRDRVRGQIRTLKYFYKNLLGWDAGSVGAWLAAGLLLACGTMLAWIPYQEYEKGDAGFFLCLSYLLGFGLFFYLWPYLTLNEGQDRKNKSIMAKLCYLPVDRGSVLLFLLKKLLKLALPLFLVQLLGQCLAAFLSYGRISPCNFLYPFLAGLLGPGGFVALAVVAEMFGGRK